MHTRLLLYEISEQKLRPWSPLFTACERNVGVGAEGVVIELCFNTTIWLNLEGESSPEDKSAEKFFLMRVDLCKQQVSKT